MNARAMWPRPWKLLASHGGDARPLAGGQSLVPLLNFRLARPAVLVDLNRIEALARITVEDGALRLGAMARQASVETDARVARGWPLLTEAIGHIAHPQIRNRGTVGGSLAHNDPAAELPAVMLALDAGDERAGPARSADHRGRVTSSQGRWRRRSHPTSCSPRSAVPALPEGTGWGFQEAARRQGDFALVAVAVLLRPTGSGQVDARVVVTGTGGGPVRMRSAEAVLTERGTDGERPGEAVGNAAAEACDAADDPHAPAWYRQKTRGGAHPPGLPRGGDADGALKMAGHERSVRVTINGEAYERRVEPRLLLSDFIRHEAGLTGTHVGCEHGVCGACTVLLDGQAGALLPDVRGAGGRRLLGDGGIACRWRDAAPAAGSLPPRARVAVRLLHARYSDDAQALPRRPIRRRPTQRFAVRSRAISAAVPATSRSWRLFVGPRQCCEAKTHDHAADRGACGAAGGRASAHRAGALHRRHPPAGHAARGGAPQPPRQGALHGHRGVRRARARRCTRGHHPRGPGLS